MKEKIYIIIAAFFIGLGTLGIFLPLLPTTPFLLVAAYLYLKSSRRRLRWLMTHKHLGPYISSYLSKKGIPMKIKIRTLILLWGTILFSFFFATENIYVRIMLITIATATTIHLVSVKNKA